MHMHAHTQTNEHAYAHMAQQATQFVTRCSTIIRSCGPGGPFCPIYRICSFASAGFWGDEEDPEASMLECSSDDRCLGGAPPADGVRGNVSVCGEVEPPVAILFSSLTEAS
jgi:hypothetical protein